MALADPYQANDFPGDLFSQHTLHQPRNHAPQNPWVSFRHQLICLLHILINAFPSGPTRSRQ